MSMKQTMETITGLRQQGVNIFLTDAGWSFLVKVTEALENNEVDIEEQAG